MLRAITSATAFNLKGARRPSHLLWIAGLILFPPALAALAMSQDDVLVEVPAFCLLYLYVTVVRVTPPLALLLWATPTISSELEQGTWPFVAIRPRGRVGVYGGGYLAALCWALLCGFSALALTLAVIRPPEPWLMARVIGELIVWGSLAYGAVYSLLGVLFLKRSMAFAVVFTLLVEVVMVMIPAVVNRLAVDFHLRTIGIKRLEGTPIEIPIVDSPITLVGSSSTVALLTLVGYTVAVLLLGGYALHRRELVLAER